MATTEKLGDAQLGDAQPIVITDSRLPRPVTYNSFSGADIRAAAFMPDPNGEAPEGGTYKIFAELQTVTISSTRNVFPVRRLGESHAHRYTRGARTIAGTLIFAVLDQDVMSELYRRDRSEVSAGAPFFVDQIPPFNVFVDCQNEYGNIASTGLVNVHLVNFGQTLSVDDIYLESTYTYVAEQFVPFVSDAQGFLSRQYLLPTGIRGRSLSSINEARIWQVPGVETDEEKLNRVMTELYQLNHSLAPAV
jgi:hypothetical protein